MAKDVLLTSDLGTEWTESGYLAAVSGAEEIRQSLLLSVLHTVDMSAPALSQQGIEQQRADIETAVRENPKSQPPVRARATDVDYENQSIDYEVTTARVQLPLTIG